MAGLGRLFAALVLTSTARVTAVVPADSAHSADSAGSASSAVFGQGTPQPSSDSDSDPDTDPDADSDFELSLLPAAQSLGQGFGAGPSPSPGQGQGLRGGPGPWQGLGDPDVTFECDVCAGPRKNVCSGGECATRCAAEHTQCYSPFGGNRGCCCDPKSIPQDPDKRCVKSISNHTCHWACCVGAGVVPCGGSCCRPSTGGAKTDCGLSLFPHKVGSKWRSTPCCVSSQAGPDEQREKNCCINGPGLQCDQPDHPPCCLWPESAVASDPDPLVPCQRNCSVYQGPCRGNHGASLGFNCTGRPGKPGSRGKSRCCLSPHPSVHDPCQPRPEQCQPAGGYVPCAGQRGIDCASPYHSVCCMPNQTCFSNCEDYDARRQRQRLFILVASGAAAVLLGLLLAVAWCCRDRVRLCLQRCFPCLSRRRVSSNEVVINSRGIHWSPMKEFTMRLALVIWCSRYQHSGYRTLPKAESDGKRVADEFQQLHYDVTRVPRATREDILQGFRTVIQKAAGRKDVLIVIYFAGHAVEVSGSLFWAGVDAVLNNMHSHVDMTAVMQGLQNLHLRKEVQQHFGEATQALPNAYFVLLAACCRETSSANRPAESCHQAKSKRRQRNIAERPTFFSIFAAEPGDTILDRSLFTEELITNMGKQFDLNELCAAIREGLKDSGESIWISGNGSRDISLAPPVTSACSEDSTSLAFQVSPREGVGIAGTGGTSTPRLPAVPES